MVEDLLRKDADGQSKQDDSSTVLPSSSAKDSGSDDPPPPGSLNAQPATPDVADSQTQTPGLDGIKEEDEVKKEAKKEVKKEVKKEKGSPRKDKKDVKKDVKTDVKTEPQDEVAPKNVPGGAVEQEAATVTPGAASLLEMESGMKPLGQVVHAAGEMPSATKKTEVATPKVSRRNPTPCLGRTYTIFPDDPNAITRPVVPPQDGLVHDLDTRIAAPALLRLCPDPGPGLNSLLLHETELMKVHKANIDGLSTIGDYAGKSY